MKRKRQNKAVIAWFLTTALCFSSFLGVGEGKTARATEINAQTLGAPVIDAQEGKIIWDTVYFGNYWKSKYIPQPENKPSEGEDDVVHEDTDGTRFLVREDKSCYRYEPLKWRVLSVNEEGTDAFLMADQALDVQRYHEDEEEKRTVTWEKSSVRSWLNDVFLKAAFTSEEQTAIIETEVENKKNPYADDSVPDDKGSTMDKVYLPSLEEVTTLANGFTGTLAEAQTRSTDNTDYVNSGGTIKSEDPISDYWLRTLGTKAGYVSSVSSGYGDIPTDVIFMSEVNDTSKSIRPVLHLDLTKTDCWSYAGKVRQDKQVIAPDATPLAPTLTPTQPPSVTMAPGQSYPVNPRINPSDLTQNTWDCIYFGNYYNKMITPSVLSLAGEDDVVKTDENHNKYITRREQGYFQYEPIKWRVLSINEDATDAVIMADQVLDLAPYYEDGTVEITWEKSDIRYWLNSKFINTAFSDNEKEKIRETTVSTADNRWSGEAGGNDTIDKIYLPSIEEMMEPAYGFSDDENEVDTRRSDCSEYTAKGGSVRENYDETKIYWLRSQGSQKGYPAKIGHWGEGAIPTETEVMEANSAVPLGVRPVMHVDLSDTSMWQYAGQVTPKGVVAPVQEEAVITPAPIQTMQPVLLVQTPKNSVRPEISKPGKPLIKQLKNIKGKKVKITLAKKIAGADGYEVAYSQKASMKNKKVKSFKGTSVTIKGLKKKKTYYFTVRSYKKQSGKSIYSSWGKKKKIKVKK